MADIAIHVEGVGKRYRIGTRRVRYRTFRETVSNKFSEYWSYVSGNSGGRTSNNAETEATIWALKDVSFEVKCGEILGIIGKNGAGKSTMLKILSRITEPTEGRCEIRGRVGSLLEVGTGFHQELTGRENIFLNGAILGMKRVEIDDKFDEIVDFAEVERFIDTPVKHYSSGMYLRLAFAVAAHLDPEILLIDEVLAVGDARFQRKCLNKMQDVGKRGRTVLFVSHNMPAIARLCERVILLGDGNILKDGPPQEVVGSYLNDGTGTSALREWNDPEKAPKGEIVRLVAVRALTNNGELSESFDIRQPVTVEMEYDVIQPGYALSPKFHFYNDEGVYIFISIDNDPEWRNRPRPAGRYKSIARIPGNLLSEGRVFVGVGLSTINPVIGQFRYNDAVAFQVIDTTDGDSARGDWGGPLRGVVRPMLKWSTEYWPEHKVTTKGEKDAFG